MKDLNPRAEGVDHMVGMTERGLSIGWKCCAERSLTALFEMNKMPCTMMIVTRFIGLKTRWTPLEWAPAIEEEK
jgi:hypothetical protein